MIFSLLRRLIGAHSEATKNSGRTRRQEEVRKPAGAFRLFDDEGNAACRLCGLENFRAVGFAVHPEPFGQANDYILPRDIAAEVFLKLGAMIAWLKVGSGLKPRFDGLLGGFDLLLELMQTATQREQQFKL